MQSMTAMVMNSGSRNGTAAGTVLVKDIRSGTGSTSFGFLTNIDGTLFFQANDGVQGNELWRSDGNAANTVMVKDIFTGNVVREPKQFTPTSMARSSSRSTMV